MRIVCDRNMPLVEDAFRTLGDVTLLDGRAITAADVRDADLLAIRSTTRVSRELLHGSRVRFVGTATIGTDHLDQAYLAEAGIAWCFSPGCNANSVSEYLTAALLCLADRHGFKLAGRTLGVIGVGNVGRRVVAKAQALGLHVLQNDPPRQRAERGSGTFVALAELLAASDIVTLHVPLAHDGQDATWQMVDAAFLGAMRPGSIFINAARGGIMSTAAVLAAREREQLAHMVIDTWEQEPDFSPALLARVDLATPHIAGHSFEGKVQGTVMVYEAACRFFGVEPRWQYAAHMPPPVVPSLDIDAADKPDETVLWQVVRQIYDIESDDLRFRAACDDRRAHFDRLRKQYPVRREFTATAVRVHGGHAGLRRKLAGLGFAVLPEA